MSKTNQRIKDISGQRFGRLIAMHYVGRNKHGKSLWECKCDCGNFTTLPLDSLRTGNTRSCGCLHKEIVKEIGYKNKKFNRYSLSGEYGVGHTLKGEEFYFDLEDFQIIKDHCWFLSRKNYVAALVNNKYCFMHILVMDKTNKNLQVDHINHDKKDNRKQNLRIVTNQENCMNHSLHKNNTSGVSGVTWHSRNEKWQARIGYKNERIHLGYFNSKEEAIRARFDAEKTYYGEYRNIKNIKMEKKL